MNKRMIRWLMTTVCVTAGFVGSAGAQSGSSLDFAEFNRRAVLPVSAGLGFVTRDARALLALEACPQFTLIDHQLRLGATAGIAYTEQTAEPQHLWHLYAGPRLALRLKTLSAALGGLPGGIAFGNVQLFAEHLWGAHAIRLVGGGLTVELLKTVGVSLKVHRDYEHQATWGQLALHYNLIRPRREPSFNPTQP